MYSIAKYLIIIALICSFSTATLYGRIRTNAQSPDEQRIQELIYQVQRGIQNQKLYLVLDYFIGEVNNPLVNYVQQKEIIENSLKKLFDSFSSRSFSGPFAEMSKTRDFRIKIKRINILPGGTEAFADLECGFVTAPVDSSYLKELSTESLIAMNDIDKLNYMRYRTCQLRLLKVDYNWNISSFGQLPQIITSSSDFFLGSIKTQDGTKKKK